MSTDSPQSRPVTPTSSLAVFVWNGEQFVPWDGGGSVAYKKNPPSPLQDTVLYFFSKTLNAWCPWDGTTNPVSGVTQLIAGTGITVSPSGGTGAVTINSTEIAEVTQIIAGTNITISPTGGTGAVTINATGGGNGAPAIPSNAVSSGILDNYIAQPWQSTHDSGTPGTSSGTSTYISPTVGRNFNFIYTANAGQRYSLFFALDTVSKNFCYDLEIAFTDPTQILNMELDMNQVIADGNTVIYDCQCAHGSGTWEFNAWHPSNILGDPQTWGAGIYRHVRIFWHRDITGNITTWDGVEFEGVYTPFVSAVADTSQSLGWAVGRLVINFQIEGSSSSGTVDAYGRNITVWRW